MRILPPIDLQTNSLSLGREGIRSLLVHVAILTKNFSLDVNLDISLS